MSRLSYVHGATDVPLLGETIGHTLDRTVERHPEREALVSCHQGRRFTWAELHREVDRAARGLLAFGVQKGDRVGIWSPNVAEWMVAQYATAKLGAILVNVNPAYRVREVEYALGQTAVGVLLLARRFRQTDYSALLGAIVPGLDEASPDRLHAPRLPGLRALVYLDEARGPGGWSWTDLLARSDEVPVELLRAREATLGFDDPINIQFTSGTTGAPKGATLSHHNILNNGFFIGQRLRLTAADRICVPVPFYHCFGMVIGNLAALTHGAAIVLPSESFDPAACLAAVAREACTALYGVPTMFIAQLQHPAFDPAALTSLRTGVMAGSPCPVALMRQVIDLMHMREVTICYGMTETSPVSFQSRVDDDLERRVSTVGTIHPHVECKIVDASTGQVVPRGTPGELCTRGYPVMLGYWGNPKATREAIDPARWMHTGDLAVMRDDGAVSIVGRLKDMIIRGGENVYPREIEEFLYTHPAVAEVQVIGVPDPKYGEEICAWVKLKPGASETSDGIREFCRGQIATFKIPRYVRFADEFPMTVTGKIQKFVMREISTAELGLSPAGPTA